MMRETIRALRRQEAPGFEKWVARACALGLMDPELARDGMALPASALGELAQVDSSLALVVLSHWIAWVQGGRGELLGCAPFELPVGEGLQMREGRLSGKALSVVVAPGASHVVLTAAGEAWQVSLREPGVRISAPVRTLGLRDCPILDLELDGARAIRVGPVGATRAAGLAAAVCLGVARASVDEAWEYSRIRRQGGRPIGEWSEVRALLGRMSTRLRAAELALEAALQRSGQDLQAVLLCSQELACELVSDGIQVLGGAGYTTEFRQEERYRAAFQLQHLLGPFAERRLALARQWETR